MPKSRKSKRTGSTKHVPYVTGFHPPSHIEATLACGDINSKKYLNPENSFKPIPKCNSENDWLAQYCEEGQSFPEFIQTCPWLSKRKCKGVKQEFVSSGTTLQAKYPKGVIYLVPLGDFNTESSPDFHSLVEYVKIFCDLPVKTLPKLNLINCGNVDFFWSVQETNQIFKIKSRTKNEKYQLNIISLLSYMPNIVPDDALCTIALTMSDLYQEKPDLFVAGMAAGNHRVGVFSFCRYDPSIKFSSEFWHEITYTKDNWLPEEKKKMILVRSCRLLVHEILHILGFSHCIYYECCMNGSGHLEEDFRQPMFLCPVDLHKLAHLCGLNIVERYHKLRTFFEKFDLGNEVEWIDERLELIKD
jgi:archaemetzincin